MKITVKKIIVFVSVAAVVLVGGHLIAPQSVDAALQERTKIKAVTSEDDFKMVLDSAGSRLMVFDLYADWCGPCRMLHPTLEKLAGKYSGKVDFYRINIDKNPGIAATFKTNGIPYVVFVKDRRAFASLVGVNPSASYEKIIAACSAGSGSCENIINTL